MKQIVSLTLLVSATLLMSPAANAQAKGGDDNKVVSGAKAVGRGIMWAPKKIGAGMKKGFTKMGDGAKKLMGK